MSAAPRDWFHPFLDQATEDLKAAYQVDMTECPSTFCMLLQMVYEKIAKAALARSGQPHPNQHQVLVRFLAVLRRYPAGRRLLATAGNHAGNVEMFVIQLELANPSVANKTVGAGSEILEYPWVDSNGTVRTPCKDLSLAKRIANPKDRIGGDCLKLASALIRELPSIVP